MSSKWIDKRDQLFLLYEILNIDNELLGKPPFQNHDAEIVNGIIDKACILAKTEMASIYYDKPNSKLVEAAWSDGKAFMLEDYQRIWKHFRDGSWLSIEVDSEQGGQGFPNVVAAACNNILLSCNPHVMMTAIMTKCVAKLIEKFGTDQLKSVYMKGLYRGYWTGRVFYAKEGHGPDYVALKAAAMNNHDGTYSILGTKRITSYIDHNPTDNIIYVIMAMIEGGSSGKESTSVFLVPKYLINPDCSLGDFNNVITTDKMSPCGYPISTIQFGDTGKCVGYLLRREYESENIVNYLMKEMRLSLGMSAVSIAGATYLRVLDYARNMDKSKIKSIYVESAVPIINHYNVRKMLLNQKSMVEGARLLCLYYCFAIDKMKVSNTVSENIHWAQIVDLLSPIVRTYCPTINLEVNNLAMHLYGCYADYRYCNAKQMTSDQLKNNLCEWTTDILDFAEMCDVLKGQYFIHIAKEAMKMISEAKDIHILNAEANIVERSLSAINMTAMYFSELTYTKPYILHISVSDYLNCVGETLCGWLHIMLAKEAIKGLSSAVNESERMYYWGIIEGAKYFINRLTALVPARCEIFRKEEISAVRIPDKAF